MSSTDLPVPGGGDARLNPAELHEVPFRRAPFGRRGFDEEHVRAFLFQVEAELVRMLNERAALEDEVTRLRERLSGESKDAGTARPGDAHVQAVRILSKAQQTADQYVNDAERYSRELAEDARRHRDEILAEARSRAALVLEEAHQKATTAAESVGNSSRPMSGDERRELEREIAYLQTFSDVYRNHLRSYLEALLRNVEEWERAQRASLAASRTERPRDPSPTPPDLGPGKPG